MPEINIGIRNKVATNIDSTEYICGNDDFVVLFDFDEEWDAFSVKTARFISNGKYVDIVFQGNECQMPIMSNTNTIMCGVFAGDLRTTTPALIGARKSILCGYPTPDAPTPDVYAQMMELYDKNLDEVREYVAVIDEAKNEAIQATEQAKQTAQEAQNQADEVVRVVGEAMKDAEMLQATAEEAKEARDQAEEAQEAAEVAKTAAETASEKAVDAQAKAEAAQEVAEQAKTAAESAQGKAEEARSASEASAQSASESASASSGFANNAFNSESAAASYAQTAFESASAADRSEANARQYASNADASATAAKTSETNAVQSEQKAKASETAAKQSEEAAAQSANEAANSAATAKQEVESALQEAKNSGEFDGVSVTHSWDGTVLTVTSASGTSSADLKGETGKQGETGSRGAGILKIKTKPVRYGTAIGDYIPAFRILLSTVKTESNATEVLNGDILLHGGDMMYRVDYIDEMYAYSSEEFWSIEGQPGEDGRTPIVGEDYWTDDDKQQIVHEVLNALPTWEGGSF